MMTFNGNMLCLARQIRKKSQDDLIEAMGGTLAQGTLSKIERGRIQPDDEVIDSFGEILRVKRSFFFNSSYLRQPPVSFHRRRKKLPARDLGEIHGISEVLRLSIEKCLDAVELEHDGPSLPAFDLEQFDGDVRKAAQVVRARLKVPRGPIRKLVKVIEDSGVIVVPFNFGTPLIDGFCQHAYKTLPSVIFINSSLPVDRFRFSLAHELGHLVCHDIPNPEQEIQANQFASEFLMPSDDINDDLRDFSLNKAMELKLYWGTSMQSLIYKAWQIGKIGDDRKTHYFIEMSRRGWRKSEPIEAGGFQETPSAFAKIVDAHLTDLGYSVGEMAEMFGLLEDDLRLYFPVRSRKPVLRVVT